MNVVLLHVCPIPRTYNAASLHLYSKILFSIFYGTYLNLYSRYKHQRSYMTYTGFEKMSNIVISNTFNGLRPLNMYKMMVDLYCTLEYLSRACFF